MKKIFLALAAVAALASCVDEKNIAPEQTGDNLVTIKALATKTTLNGTDVVWEADDAIKVVFNSSETQYVADFATTDAGETAVFTGSLDAAVTSDACGETGYAVYPATVAIESDGKIPFAVSSIQDGKVATGENLSYATVSLSKIKATGSDEAVFHNALSMLQITVPEGVKKVTVSTNKMQDLESAYPAVALAGKAPFFYTEGSLQINEAKWGNSGMELEPGTDILNSVDYKLKSVVLKNADDSELAAGVHYVQVFPGTHVGLTVTVEGAGFSYTKVIDQSFTFVASQYHPLNITNIFNLGSTSYAASPFGGIVEIPVITTVDEYEVTIPAEATWLTKTPSAKGTFHKDIVSFTAAANTTGEERDATVTINGVEVVISQKGYVPELLNEYVETYSQYGQPFTGTLTIEATDNASFGVYKVKICGSTLYADYSGGKLVLHDGNKDRELVVSADYKTISAASLSLGYASISDYKAILPLGPAELTPEEEALVGEYNESWTFNGTPVTSPAGLKISASDEASFGKFKVVFLTVNGSGAECYANLSVDGTKLQLDCYGASHPTYFSIAQPIDMSINSDGSLSFASAYNQQYREISNYKATRVADSGDGDEGDGEEGTGVTLEDLKNTTWNESFNLGGGSHTGTLTISETDDSTKGQLKVKMLSYGSYTKYYLECYADLNQDGKILTIKSTGATYNGMNCLVSCDIILNIKDNGNTLEGDGSFGINPSWGLTLTSYIATKQ